MIGTLLWFVSTIFCEDAPINHVEDEMRPSDDVIDINPNITRDENHPMLKVIQTKPHSMTLKIKPKIYKPDTMIRLLYERVPLNKGPFMLHLDDPVIEIIPLTKQGLSYTLTELPMGKYVVCGEAMVKGEVYQASCFETRIERLDNNTLQYGVKIIIAAAIVLVILVVIYAILYQMWKSCKTKGSKCGQSSL